MTPAAKTYAIRFDFPESDEPLFAGRHQGALGWAPRLATALLFETAEAAKTLLENGYGDSGRWARVIEVKAGEPV